MKLEDIEHILKEQKPFLTQNYFVDKIGVFGSYAREEQKETSDIDLVVQFTRPVGFEFLDLKDYLENVFEKRVDLVTVNALKPMMREEILGEVHFQ